MSPPTTRQRDFEHAFMKLRKDGVSPLLKDVARELDISAVAAHRLAHGLIKRGRARIMKGCERSFELITKEGGAV